MEDSSNISVKSVSIKYGVILGLISIIYFVILDFIGKSTQQEWNYVGLIFSAIVFYFAYKEFKEQGDGYMSYGQGLGIGTLTSLVSSVISGVFSFIYIKFINTAYIENIKQMQIAKLEEQGLSDAQIEQAQPMMDMFTSPVAILIMAIFMGTLLGFILSLILSAIFKQSRPELI